MLLAFVVGVAAVVAVAVPVARRGGGATPATAPAPATTQLAAAQSTLPVTEINRLLGARARAVLSGDRTAFLATVDRGQASFYRAQQRYFANARTVPLARFQYRLPDLVNLASEQVKRRFAPRPVWVAPIELHYSFNGHERNVIVSRVHYTFVRGAAGWRVAAQGLAGERDDVAIWELGPVQHLASQRTLVLFLEGGRPLAQRVLQAAERGYAQVRAGWSQPWEEKVVILVPGDQRQAEQLAGQEDLGNLAGMVVTSGSRDGGRKPGTRIVINTGNARAYDQLNLQVLVTHEMVHVATRDVAGNIPLYLAEGFADYVALRPLSYPLHVTRPDLAEAVRAGRFDGKLPTDGDFRDRDGDAVALAYDKASSFCLWLAETYGEAKLQALYRSFDGERSSSRAARDGHFTKVLGVRERTAEAGWAAWVRERL